ncbi:MAG: glycosyltransferase family 4 protein [Candidatus Baldrarchaeia archaeon]
MKVLFFLGSPNPSPGADWTRIGFFADYFRNRGHRVYVAGIFSPYSLSKAGLICWKDIKIYNICPIFLIENILSLLFNIFSSFITLPLLLVFLRPNLTIISVPTGESAIGAYFASRRVGAKVIIDYRDEWEDYIINKSRSKIYRGAYRLLKTLMTKIYLKSDLISVVTPAIAKSLFLRGVKNVKVVLNGADVSVFKPYDKVVARRELGLCMDDFIIVYNGGIGGYYRLDVVVRALKKFDSVPRDKVKLLIVGEGPDLPKIMSMAKDFGLENNVVYLGVKNDKVELAEVLSTADVGIVPYDDNPLWRNSLPAKFFEYCSCGIPVIATVYEDSLLAKLINKYEIGLVVPPMDEEKLAEAIRYICENKSFRELAGKRARLFIEEKFDRSKIAEKFLSLVGECMRDEKHVY